MAFTTLPDMQSVISDKELLEKTIEQRNQLGTIGKPFEFVDYNDSFIPNKLSSSVNSPTATAKAPEPHIAEHIKQTNTNNKLGPFEAPFDFRIADAYVDNIPLGNNMPGDPDMIGSPTLMNSYAVIRFHHISNMKHYQKVYNYEGNFDFKGNSIQYPLNADSPEGKKALENLKANGGKDEMGDVYELVPSGLVKWKYKGEDKTIIATLDKERTKCFDKTSSPIDDAITNSPIMKLEKCYACKKKIKNDPDNPNGEAKEQKFNITTNYEGYITRAVCAAFQSQCNQNDFKEIKETELFKNFESYNGKKTGEESYLAHIEAEKKKIDDAKNWEKLPDTDHCLEKKYLYPEAETPSQTKEILPTTDNLCNMDNWIGDEQFFYKYSDFMWCTQYENIPNNRLITLRRFPVPVYDHGRIPDQDSSKQYMLPIARMVTWIDGDTNQLNNFYEMSWNYNWKDVEAEINDVQNFNEGGTPNLGGFADGIAKALDFFNRSDNKANVGMSSIREWSGDTQESWQVDPYQNGPKANLINGPVNAITKTKMRDRGLEFSQSFTIIFSYELKEFGGINPKVAMLDIIANFAAVTFNNAGFWGGANRYFPNKTNYPFLGAKKGANAFMRGDIGGWVTSIGEQFASAMSNVASILSNMFSNPIETLLNAGETVAKTWMAKRSANMRPQILGVKSLLTGEPVGEWHLMVGNPFNPALMVGNLIVTNASLRPADDAYIGADDFPSKWEMEVTLDHGKPRDKGDIESMFNRGYGRLHYAPYGNSEEEWNKAYSTQNSGRSVQRGTYKVGYNVSDATSNANNQSPIIKSSAKDKIYVPARSRSATSINSKQKYYSNVFRNFGVNVVNGAKAIQLAVGTGFKNWNEDRPKTSK